MSSNVAIDLIDRQNWLDQVADALQPAIAETFQSAGTVGQKVEDFLHGTWLGHPLHSVLTDVPVGAWTAALVLDAMDEMSDREEFGRGADAAVTVGIAQDGWEGASRRHNTWVDERDRARALRNVARLQAA
jgi:hypothetical protein